MGSTIDTQAIGYLNLFSKITRVPTSTCFTYNNILMFGVDKAKLSSALGKNGDNLKKVSTRIKKRIRIIAKPRDISDAKIFFEKIVAPTEFKEIQITETEFIVTAGGKENKAMLLGRQKRRYEEMRRIIKDFFKLEYRIV